jgi:hypothetical protein
MHERLSCFKGFTCHSPVDARAFVPLQTCLARWPPPVGVERRSDLDFGRLRAGRERALQGGAFLPAEEGALQQQMVDTLKRRARVVDISPDALALTLAGATRLGPLGQAFPSVREPLRSLRASAKRNELARTTVARMPSMHIDRVVLAALALGVVRARGPRVTGALAQEMIERVAEAAPWAVARAVALTERDDENKHCGMAVAAMHDAAADRMADAWDQSDFIEGMTVAIHESQQDSGRAGRWSGRKGAVSRLVLMMDKAAAEAVDRFEPDKVFEVLVQMSDAGLDEGKLIAAYVKKTNAETAAMLGR